MEKACNKTKENYILLESGSFPIDSDLDKKRDPDDFFEMKDKLC